MPAVASRVLAAVCALVLVAGVAAAATYESDSADTDTDMARAGSTSTTATTSNTGASPTSEVVSPETTDTAPASTAATSAPPTTTPPTSASASGPPPEPTRRQLGTTPGTYLYDVSGTANGEDVSGTSTLEVDPVGADGRQTHVQSAPDGTTTTVYRHAAEGTYLESLEIESQQGSFRLEATSPYLLLPADATAGTTTRGTLEGGDLVAQVEFTVVEVGAETSTATLHVDLSGELSGFEIDGTMDSTLVARSSDQLTLESEAESDIVVGGGVFRIRSDTRSVLRR